MTVHKAHMVYSLVMPSGTSKIYNWHQIVQATV